MKLNESNGSQVKQVDPSVVGDVDPSETIKRLTIGDIVAINDYVPITSEESSPNKEVPSTSKLVSTSRSSSTI